MLVAASGCAQLFGLDETSGPDVDPTLVSLTMQKWSIAADVSKEPLDLTDHMPTFLADDGAGGFTRIAGEITEPGVASASVPDGALGVMFTLPDLPTPYARLWQTPSRHHRGIFAAFGRPNAEEPLPNSEIVLTATLPSAYQSNEAFRIEAIGAWTGRAVTPVEPADGTATTITATLPYSSFSRLTSAPAARITSADVVVIERYVGNLLTGVYQVPPFDQTDGQDPIDATLVAVPANRPLNATVAPASYADRFSAVRPAVSGLSQSWVVSAAPGWAIGSTSGPRLHGGVVAMADTTISTMFGNPFESLGWRALFQFTAQATRNHMFMDAAGITLSSSMFAVAEPSDMLALEMPAGLPINIRANEMPLSTDGMTLSLDLAKAVEIDAILDRPSCAFHSVTLYKVELNAEMTSVVRTIVVEVAGAGEPKVRLPPDLFEPGSSYYVDFRCMDGGFVDAAAGDFQNLSLPYSVSRADSAVFQVVAP